MSDTATIERRYLEELYRQHVSAVRTLAKALGYPCPILDRRERHNQPKHKETTCATLESQDAP